MSKGLGLCWTTCITELQWMADAAGVAEAKQQSFSEAMEDLSQIPQPLPHAAWKKLVQDVQVTAKLAALCLQALQQPDDPLLAFKALIVWLQQAVATMRVSPESQAAAAVRQQLQVSGLLQHLGPAMDAAAARLTAAVAALAAATSCCSGGSSRTATPSTSQQDSIHKDVVRVEKADMHCGLLLTAFRMVGCTLSQQLRFSAETAAPAAPAAMRTVVTGFQACSRLQQLWQQKKDQVPLQVGKLAVILNSFVFSTGCYALLLPVAVYSGALESTPAGRELLLSPDFVSCLTIVLVVTVLGLDASSDGGIPAAATPAAGSSSAPGASSSAGQHMPGAGRQQQQAGSSGSVPISGVLLDSLTPLSCSLFDILGVSKETVLQAAKVARAAGLTTVRDMGALVVIYSNVLLHQVDQAQSAFSAQLLLQLETDLLLSLMVLQLTASLPDSCPGVHTARHLMCQVSTCDPLQTLWRATDLHRLPGPAAYAGPQVALQLLPSPYEPQQPTLGLTQQRRRQQQQHQQQQPVEWCVLAPTAPLLTELLPLLTRIGLKQLQQQKQQPAAFPLVSTPTASTTTVDLCMKGLYTLLACSVVPRPGAAAAAEGLPPAVAAAGPRGDLICTTYSCVLHAEGACLAHACDIISIFEWSLRNEALLQDATTAATTAAAGNGTGGAASTGGAAAAAAVQGGSVGGDRLQIVGDALCLLCCYGCNPCQPGPLVRLGHAAGPGSQVQRQLHSLLATMVKLGGCSKGPLGSKAARRYPAAAGYAALALLVRAVADNQQLARAAAAAGATDRSSDPEPAVTMLPSVVILGRCFMQWGEQVQAEATLLQEDQQHRCNVDSLAQAVTLRFDSIAAVQLWLASGSICDQLAAAGYAPLPVLQQVEQLLGACLALQDSPSNTAALLAAAQQLQSTGLALCSFAVPCMCNNPGCTSMAGLSELAAVSGRSCICGGCRVARYCGRACQRAVWKQHKPVCAALSAAGVGAGAAVGAAL